MKSVKKCSYHVLTRHIRNNYFIEGQGGGGMATSYFDCGLSRYTRACCSICNRADVYNTHNLS